MTSGSRSLIGEALSWIVGLGICAVALLNYDAIKGFILQNTDLPQRVLATRPDTPAAEGVKSTNKSGSITELRLARDGHYHADAEINGRSIQVMVDTGATMVALTFEDAERAGIYVKDSDFTHRVSTANGPGRVAPVTIGRITIGEITVRNVQGAVVEAGKLTKTLLGMSFLGRLSRTEMRSGVLLLEE
jgi:aspartyl protease family protein